MPVYGCHAGIVAQWKSVHFHITEQSGKFAGKVHERGLRVQFIARGTVPSIELRRVVRDATPQKFVGDGAHNDDVGTHANIEFAQVERQA
jgi:hypothetical protein